MTTNSHGGLDEGVAFAVSKLTASPADDQLWTAAEAAIATINALCPDDDNLDRKVTIGALELALLALYAGELKVLADCGRVLAEHVNAVNGLPPANVISFPSKAFPRGLPPADRPAGDMHESPRLRAIHWEGLPLDELAANLGTPAQWLDTAIGHLKVHTSIAYRTATVSVAALHLVLWHLEAIEHGVEPWPGNAPEAA